MGVLVNAVNDAGTTLGEMPRVPKGPFGPYVEPDPEAPGNGEGDGSGPKEISYLLNRGSKMCPVVGEMRRLGHGIA